LSHFMTSWKSKPREKLKKLKRRSSKRETRILYGTLKLREISSILKRKRKEIRDIRQY
jgi:hypothetical protein